MAPHQYNLPVVQLQTPLTTTVQPQNTSIEAHVWHQRRKRRMYSPNNASCISQPKRLAPKHRNLTMYSTMIGCPKPSCLAPEATAQCLTPHQLTRLLYSPKCPTPLLFSPTCFKDAPSSHVQHHESMNQPKYVSAPCLTSNSLPFSHWGSLAQVLLLFVFCTLQLAWGRCGLREGAFVL